MEKTCGKIIIVLLVALLLIVSATLFYAFKTARSLEKSWQENGKTIEKQMDNGQLIGVGPFLYNPSCW